MGVDSGDSGAYLTKRLKEDRRHRLVLTGASQDDFPWPNAGPDIDNAERG
jgi:hypothetical protein